MKKIILSLLVGLFYLSQAYAKPIHLVLNWKPEPQFGGFYTAQINSLFNKKSLDVKIIPGGSGTPTVQMVAAGQAEFGIASAEELLVSRSHGTDLVALFAIYQNSPLVIMSHPSQNFKSIQDILKSKDTLELQSGLPFFLFLKKKLGPIKATIVPHLGGIANFLHNPTLSQQGLITSEPLLVVKQGKESSNFLVSSEGFNPYMSVLIARKVFIEKNLETTKSMVQAVREGWNLYVNNPENTNEFMNKLNPSMDIHIFNESAKLQKKFILTEESRKLGLGIMLKDRWKSLADQLKSVEVINKVPDINEIFMNL